MVGGVSKLILFSQNYTELFSGAQCSVWTVGPLEDPSLLFAVDYLQGTIVICPLQCIAMLWWLISMKSSGLDNWKTRQSCFLLIIICQTGTVTIAFHLCAICQLHMCCHLQRHDYKSNINQVCLNKDKSRNLSCTANAMGAAPKPQLAMYLVCTSASTSTSTSEFHQNPLR